MRFLWALPAWLLLTAALLLPQLALYTTDSVILALLAAIVSLGLLAWSLLHVAPTLGAAALALAVAVAVTGLTASFATAHLQRAALLVAGKSLEGVTLAHVLERGEHGMWVSLADARVRSEATYTLHFVSGSAGRQGQPGTRSHTSNVLAPVTLAADVLHEYPIHRQRPTGPIPLWACAENSSEISEWDRERQAVRGTLTRIEDHVAESLRRELSPAAPAPIPGAGAIAAAPGAMPDFPDAAAPDREVALSLAANAWCVNLERTLDAATARASALASALILLIALPLFTLGVLMLIVHVRPDPPR